MQQQAQASSLECFTASGWLHCCARRWVLRYRSEFAGRRLKALRAFLTSTDSTRLTSGISSQDGSLTPSSSWPQSLALLLVKPLPCSLHICNHLALCSIGQRNGPDDTKLNILSCLNGTDPAMPSRIIEREMNCCMVGLFASGHCWIAARLEATMFQIHAM